VKRALKYALKRALVGSLVELDNASTNCGNRPRSQALPHVPGGK